MAGKSHPAKRKPRAPPPVPVRPAGRTANPLKQGPQRWQRAVRYVWDKKKG